MTSRAAVAAVLLAAVLLAVPVAMAAPAAVGSGVGAQDEGEDDVAPGERVSGAIGAEQAELDGEVSERSFGVRLDRAASDEERADVVGSELDAVERRLAALDERLAALEQRREEGEITHGEYAASVARIEAERRSLERRVQRTEAGAERLPDGVRAERGADRERVQTLRQRASELGGQEVREIARGIAGPGVGNGVGPPANVPGNGHGVGNASVGPPDHAPVAGTPADPAGPRDTDDPSDPDDSDS